MSGDSDSVRPVDNDLGGMITLKCGDDSRILKLDRAILTKHCKYFEDEKTADCHEICFDNEISYEIIETIGKFMQGKADKLKPSMDNIVELFHAAEFLRMDGVIQILMNFLRNDMKSQNIVKIKKRVLLAYLRIIALFNRYAGLKYYGGNFKKTFKAKSWKDSEFTVAPELYIAVNFHRIMYDKLILDLDYDDLWRILSSWNLSITEADVLTTIKMWVFHDIEERKHLFPNLLELVHFNSNLNMQWFMDELTCYCNRECDCLHSKGYLISMFSLKDGGPAIGNHSPTVGERNSKFWTNLIA